MWEYRLARCTTSKYGKAGVLTNVGKHKRGREGENT